VIDVNSHDDIADDGVEDVEEVETICFEENVVSLENSVNDGDVSKGTVVSDSVYS